MTTRSVSTALLALHCLTISCNQGASHARPPVSAQPSKQIVDRDTSAVYEVLLGRSTENAVKDVVAIKDHTSAGRSCSELSMTVEPQMNSAGKDFISQNRSDKVLGPENFAFGHSVRVIPSAELDGIFADGAVRGWANFHNRYPEVRGYIDLSAVGFSADKQFAIVYSAIHCGPKCGTGGIVTLAKTGGVWRKNATHFCSWIS